MYDQKAKIIFEDMIKNGHIPETGQFIITDEILDISVKTRHILFNKKPNSKLTNSNYRFHKKIAGVNFLHLNAERANAEINKKEVEYKSPVMKQPSGILYIISNPAYPEYIKVGLTRDLKARLLTYQTYDPLRRFEVIKSVFVENVSHVEKYLLDTFKIHDIMG